MTSAGLTAKRGGPLRGRVRAPGDKSISHRALILGAAAGFDLAVTFTGDASLRGRPMNRVMKPLRDMGALFLGHSGGRLPLTLKGGGLRRIEYRLPEPSAQVKSAVLLAGLHAEK